MAYITNLGKYAEGQLVGKWQPFPTTTEALQQTLKEIGIDGIRYEEVFITEYRTELSSLHRGLGEHQNLDELNYLAHLLQGLDDTEKLDAILKTEYIDGADDVINLIEFVDGLYEYIPEVTNDEAFGRYLVEECGTLSVPDDIVDYFDFEAYGRSEAINQGVNYVDRGCIIKDERLQYEGDCYRGPDDIPKNYRVMKYPLPDSLQQGKQAPIQEEPDLEEGEKCF